MADSQHALLLLGLIGQCLKKFLKYLKLFSISFKSKKKSYLIVEKHIPAAKTQTPSRAPPPNSKPSAAAQLQADHRCRLRPSRQSPKLRINYTEAYKACDIDESDSGNDDFGINILDD